MIIKQIKIKSSALFLVLLLFTPKLFATTADSVLVSYAKNLQKHSCFSANFTQTRHLTLFPKPLISKGKISFLAPNNIRFDYNEPFKSVIIFSKGKMQRYRFENGKAVKQNSMEEVAKAITNEVMRFIKGEFSKDMPYTVKFDRSKIREIVLIPQNSLAKSIFKSITLTFSDDLSYLERIKLLENEGDFIDIFHEKPSYQTIPRSFFDIEK